MSKTREIGPKIPGPERSSSGTVFGMFLDQSFYNFQGAKHCKCGVFAIVVLKDNNVKSSKNTVGTDVCEGPCAENTVNTVVFGATCKKRCTYRVFLRFLAQKYRYVQCFLIPKCRTLRT